MKRNIVSGVFALAVLFIILDNCDAQYNSVGRNCTNPDQVFTECASACSLTCDDYVNPKNWCTLQCIIGCICRPGYAFQTTFGTRCVPISDCRRK
uniref:Putative protease inhibitor n=1 Tax=Superstitionia donensis TaxID=311983 RepID=A0A1V1WBK0_9SCOR